MNDFKITKKLIQKAKDKYACQDGIKWLEKKERTWLELKSKSYEWAVWGMTFIKDIPIDLDGLNSSDRAKVMVHRPDCPIDLTGLDSWYRACVMVNRPDCQIDLTGLNSRGRAWVIRKRGKNE